MSMIDKSFHLCISSFLIFAELLGLLEVEEHPCRMAGPLRRAAVILSGCGFRDGSEIFESVFLLTHLNREGAETHVFAPDAPQAAVINHLTGDVMDSPRNQLLEAARIARGQIQPLSNLKPDEFDAVLLPGGFGAATNLSNFASNGSDMEVSQPLKNLLLEFKQQGKPLGFCCIAPVIAAKLFPKWYGILILQYKGSSDSR